jgi:hypothetical protein
MILDVDIKAPTGFLMRFGKYLFSKRKKKQWGMKISEFIFAFGQNCFPPH